MTDEDVAWAAGFIEGKGCFSVCDGRGAIQATQKRREPLEKLQRVLGGHIYYTPSTGMYCWSVASAKDVLRIIEKVEGYLFSKQKERARLTKKAAENTNPGGSKLTDEEVRKICKYAWQVDSIDNLPQNVVAYAFDVSPMTVSRIKNGQRRAELTKDIRKGKKVKTYNKLEREEVEDIYLSNEQYEDIAEEYGASISTISRIKSEERRTDITRDLN